MAEGRVTLPLARGAGETQRRDKWWVQPLAVFLGFSAFIVYSTWAAFQNDHYTFGNYLSPFYAPAFFSDPTKSARENKSLAFKDSTPPSMATRAAEQEHHTFFPGRPGWWPSWMLFSTAFLILWIPAGFRFTCYYYRGAYYKAFWGDPFNCAVGEPRKSYWGEQWWPLLFQNIHRYFLYLAIVFIFLLSYDAIHGFIFLRADGRHFGIGVGSLVLLVNVILLASYTLGCHSFRHLVGGYRDQLAYAPTQKQIYDCVSCLNSRHGMWAWLSLFSVGFSDVYVRMCSMGIWTDYQVVF